MAETERNPDRGGEAASSWPAGWTVEHVAETGSTNVDLLESAGRRPNRSVLVADHQDAGRGRRDRRWEAPAGENLLVSVLFHEVPPDAGELPRRVTLAAVDASRQVLTDAGARPLIRLKWPNDVLFRGAKLAGVLAQRAGGAVVVGIGINVGWAPDGAARLGPGVHRHELLAAMLSAYDLLPAAPGELMRRYREELATLGQRVRLEMAKGDLVGTAVDLAAGGQLLVRDDAGVTHRIDVADVTHLRPA